MSMPVTKLDDNTDPAQPDEGSSPENVLVLKRDSDIEGDPELELTREQLETEVEVMAVLPAGISEPLDDKPPSVFPERRRGARKPRTRTEKGWATSKPPFLSKDVLDARTELEMSNFGPVELVKLPSNEERLGAWLETRLDPNLKNTTEKVLEATEKLLAIRQEQERRLEELGIKITWSDASELALNKPSADIVGDILGDRNTLLDHITETFSDGRQYYSVLYQGEAYDSSGLYVDMVAALAGFKLSDKLKDALLRSSETTRIVCSLFYREDLSPRRILEVCSGPARVTRYLGRQKRNLDPYIAQIAGKKGKQLEIGKRMDAARERDPDLAVTDYCDSMVKFLSEKKGLSAVSADICRSDFRQILDRAKLLERGHFDFIHGTLDADRTEDYRVQLQNIKSVAVPGKTKFLFSELLPCSDVGNSMTAAMPEMMFWNRNKDQRASLINTTRADAITRMVIMLAAEGFIVKRISEHKHAVISPHSCVTVSELRQLVGIDANDSDEEEKGRKFLKKLHIDIMPRGTKQIIANATGMIIPDDSVEGGIIRKDESVTMKDEDRIVLPEIDILTDFAGDIRQIPYSYSRVFRIRDGQ
jgi:hypothetical protein